MSNTEYKVNYKSLAFFIDFIMSCEDFEFVFGEEYTQEDLKIFLSIFKKYFVGLEFNSTTLATLKKHEERIQEKQKDFKIIEYK